MMAPQKNDTDDIVDDVHYLFGSVGLFVAAIMNEFWEDMDATDHNCHCNCARVDVVNQPNA